MKKPTPEQVEQLRAAYPKGSPRIDYREMPLAIATRAPRDVRKAKKKKDDAAAAELDLDDEVDEGAEGGGEEGGEAQRADENAPIDIAISSEAPVLRYDWWDDEMYYEVLDHSPSSVVLDYSRDGMPFVSSHRSWDADSQHGIVENVRVTKKTLRGAVRFSRFPESQRFAMDMRDGIRKKVSVGYIVGDQYEQTEKAADGVPIRRYMAWMPIETSTVPVPADYAVGVGRAQSEAGRDALARFLALVPARTTATPATRAAEVSAATPAETRAGARAAAPVEIPAAPLPNTQAPKAEERTMSDTTTAPAGGNATPQITVGAEASAIERVNNITAMAAQHGFTDRLKTWLSEGTPEIDVIRQINTGLAERLAKPIQTNNGPEFRPDDHRRFSLARALMVGNPLEQEVRQQPSLKIDLGFEREVLTEMQRHMAPHNQGQTIPLSMLRACLSLKQREQMIRAGIDSTVSTTGQPFKFTQPGEFIPILRNKTSVMRAGSTVISGLTGPVTFPKQTSAAGVVWSAENPGSDNSVTNLLTTTVTLSFKSIFAGTAFSRQMLFSAASGNYDMEAIVENDLAAVIGIGIDLAGLNGSGTSNQPKGVLKNTSIGSVAIGTNGGSATWGNWVDLETKIGQANANTSRMAYITNSAQRGTAKKTAVLGNTASGVPIWTGNPEDDYDGQVNGYRAIASEQVPANLTKGTSTTICSAIVFGAWEHNLIGMFGPGFETIVDPYSKKYQGMIEVSAWSYIDVAQRYDGAFAAVQDAL